MKIELEAIVVVEFTASFTVSPVKPTVAALIGWSVFKKLWIEVDHVGILIGIVREHVPR